MHLLLLRLIKFFRYCFKIKRLLIFAGLFIALYLIQQLHSVWVLNQEMRRQSRPKLQTNYRGYEKADGLMMGLRNSESPKSHDSPQEALIKGVLPDYQKYYKPNADNKFRCINSGELIDFSFLNDDFCDCSDSTDEPSTSACSQGRFFCTHQCSDHSKTNSIMSYKVNDGICDCCDGSDEWNSINLPSHTKVQANLQKGIFQVPCPITCAS